MKKTISGIAASVLLTALAACGGTHPHMVHARAPFTVPVPAITPQVVVK